MDKAQSFKRILHTAMDKLRSFQLILHPVTDRLQSFQPTNMLIGYKPPASYPKDGQ
jgi:hypothetical protein